MTSCEPNRTRAYDEDLRWRMVWQSEALNYSMKKIAGNLCVDRSTVSRTLNLFRCTGSVTKKNYPTDKAFRKLAYPAQILILNLVVSRPGIYLIEIQMELLNILMIEVDISTICRFLHTSGFSHQKMTQVALQRDTYFRQSYAMDVAIYKPEMLVFIDETGADHRNCIRKFGYSLRGIPVKQHTMLVRGERTSAIAMISIKGILDVLITSGTVNGDIFYEFARRNLIPQLQPFNGINPHSVVIMDNCSIHHVSEIVKMIEGVGAMVHFLPPYSPDYNPIELAFSKVKRRIKDLEVSSVNGDIENIMLSAFTSISEQDCQGWVAHCGYSFARYS